MVAQIMLHPRAIGIASAVLLFFALVPGLPQLPFLALAALTGVVSYLTYQAKKASLLREEQEEVEASKARTRERVESLLPLDILALEVGYGLIPLVDVEQGGELLERIKSVRRQFALDMGIIVPPMHVRDNLQLDPDEYVILIKGNEVAKGKLMAGRLLAMNPGSIDEEVEGVPTHEPAFGIPALWVTEKLRDRAQAAGYTVVDHSTVVATHISEVIKAHADELLGRQEVQLLLDHFSERYPKVVEELIPNLLSLGATQKVLQNLLRERVSIRDLLTILETLADYAPVTKSTDILTEYVRQRLARLITKSYRTPEGDLFLLTLNNDIEETISGAIQHTEQESYLSLEPSVAQKILAQLRKGAEGFRELNTHPIVLCSPPIRSQLKKLTERFIPNLTVLSHNEITNDVKIKPVGMVSLTNAH
jgi:flagellar biosynthesis protein FlhA